MPRARRRLAAALLAALAASLPATFDASVAHAATNASNVAPGGRAAVKRAAVLSPFGAASFWRAPLVAGGARDLRSAALVADLVRQVAVHGTWINTAQYSTGVYEVPAGQPRVPVRLDAADPVLREAFASVPLPPGALPSPGTDGSLVVWQRSTDTVWELWRARRDATGAWRAAWGGRLRDASRGNGAFPYPHGVAASGLSLLGGLIRPGEIRRGRIGHVVGMAVPDVTRGVFRAPATRTDGTVTGGGIPEGTLFRLPRSVDVRALGLPWAAALIAKAAQDHGLVVQDRGGAVAFYGESPGSIGSNPWPALFEHRAPDRMLARFPWALLEVVPAPESRR